MRDESGTQSREIGREVRKVVSGLGSGMGGSVDLIRVADCLT